MFAVTTQNNNIEDLSKYGTQGKNFCTRGEYFNMSNGVFNFNFLALVFCEILGGPKFTLGGLRNFLPKARTSQYLIVFLISTF